MWCRVTAVYLFGLHNCDGSISNLKHNCFCCCLLLLVSYLFYILIYTCLLYSLPSVFNFIFLKLLPLVLVFVTIVVLLFYLFLLFILFLLPLPLLPFSPLTYYFISCLCLYICSLLRAIFLLLSYLEVRLIGLNDSTKRNTRFSFSLLNCFVIVKNIILI